MFQVSMSCPFQGAGLHPDWRMTPWQGSAAAGAANAIVAAARAAQTMSFIR